MDQRTVVQEVTLRHWENPECIFAYCKWQGCFLPAGVPLFHLDIFPTWFSGSCWRSGQRSLCQTPGPYSQPWWVQQAQSPVSCYSLSTVLWSSSIDLQYRLSVQSCCNWLLVYTAHYSLVLNFCYVLVPFYCLGKSQRRTSAMYVSLSRWKLFLLTVKTCSLIVFLKSNGTG